MIVMQEYSSFGGETGGEKAGQRRCSVRLSPSPPVYNLLFFNKLHHIYQFSSVLSSRRVAVLNGAIKQFLVAGNLRDILRDELKEEVQS